MFFVIIIYNHGCAKPPIWPMQLREPSLTIVYYSNIQFIVSNSRHPHYGFTLNNASYTETIIRIFNINIFPEIRPAWQLIAWLRPSHLPTLAKIMFIDCKRIRSLSCKLNIGIVCYGNECSTWKQLWQTNIAPGFFCILRDLICAKKNVKQ